MNGLDIWSRTLFSGISKSRIALRMVRVARSKPGCATKIDFIRLYELRYKDRKNPLSLGSLAAFRIFSDRYLEGLLEETRRC